MDTNFDLLRKAEQLRLPLRFIGNKDQLPPYLHNGTYIINMQDDVDSKGGKLRGTHWVCVYIENKQGVYMDSFGLLPPANVQLWLYPIRPIIISSKQIQNIHSGHCGEYCLSFLRYMFFKRNVPLKKRLHTWLSLFSDDPTHNLKILNRTL